MKFRIRPFASLPFGFITQLSVDEAIAELQYTSEYEPIELTLIGHNSQSGRFFKIERISGRHEMPSPTVNGKMVVKDNGQTWVTGDISLNFRKNYVFLILNLLLLVALLGAILSRQIAPDSLPVAIIATSLLLFVFLASFVRMRVQQAFLLQLLIEVLTPALEE
jgi:hypothetical protein